MKVIEPSWISLETVYAFQARQIDRFGGLHGVRDGGLIESAVAYPRQLFSYEEPPPTIERLAAGYGFALAKNHGFIDGNKRVAAATALAFLIANLREIEATSLDVFTLFDSLADGKVGEAQAITWFEERCTRVVVWKPTR